MRLFETPSPGSFRRQIILTFVVGFFLLISAFGAYLVLTERDNLHRDSVNETASLAQALAASARPGLLAHDAAGLQEVVHLFQGYSEFGYAMVISPDGRVIAHSDASRAGGIVEDEPGRAALKAPYATRTVVDNADLVDVAVPIEREGELVGWARVGMLKVQNALYLRQMVRNTVLFLLLSTMLSGLAAMLIATRLGRSIGSLVRVAEDVLGGNFATRAAIPAGEDEIAILGSSLNKMLDAISRNEHDLRAASLYTRSLIEASLDPLLTISVEGKITDVNRATEQATGRSRAKLVGTDFSDYFTDPEKAQEGYRQVFARGFVTDFPLTLRHRDGHLTDVLYNASVYRDEASKVLGAFAAARDVTERKRAEEALRKSEERLRLEIARMPIGYIIWDRDFRAVTWNPAAAAIFGYSFEEAKGRRPHEMIVPADGQSQLDEVWRGLLAGNQSAYSENENVTKDGRTIVCQWTNTPLTEPDGKVYGVMSMVHDITERKKAEREVLRLNAELERRVKERTAELESFSYSVSHDLRVPLRAVDGFSRILLEDYGDKLDDEGKRLLGVVRENTERMARLIDDILAFSRLGRREITLQHVDMTALANEAAAELAPSWAGRDLRLEIGALPPAQGDAAMLHQVWINLLGNAIKFTRGRTRALIVVSGRAEGNELVYCIRDNGAGFDMQYVDKLFGVFQRLHGTEEFEGTGAGLAIVKRIVTRHGGRVWAEGKVDEGAVFCFTLPAASEDLPEKETNHG